MHRAFAVTWSIRAICFLLPVGINSDRDDTGAIWAKRHTVEQATIFSAVRQHQARKTLAMNGPALPDEINVWFAGCGLVKDGRKFKERTACRQLWPLSTELLQSHQRRSRCSLLAIIRLAPRRTRHSQTCRCQFRFQRGIFQFVEEDREAQFRTLRDAIN